MYKISKLKHYLQDSGYWGPTLIQMESLVRSLVSMYATPWHITISNGNQKYSVISFDNSVVLLSDDKNVLEELVLMSIFAKEEDLKI